MIYVDEQGVLCMESSSSIANYEDIIFPRDVTERLWQKATSSSSTVSQQRPATKRKLHSVEQSIATSHCGQGSMIDGLQHASQHADSLATLIPYQWQTGVNKRQKKNSRAQKSSNKRFFLPVGDTCLLRQYYEKAFEKFQQTNCRIIAKAFIKLVEPRKQVNYPYNGRGANSTPSRRADPETTKPKWWPAGVTHKEPDHLLKTQRVRLLVHILCELRESHGITADKLRDASQEVRRSISPPANLDVLDEMFHVRSMEEKFLSGELAGKATVTVSRVHVADAQSVEIEEATHERSISRSPARVAARSPAVTANLCPPHGSAGVSDDSPQSRRQGNNFPPQPVHGLALLHGPSPRASTNNDAYRRVVQPYATPALSQNLPTSMPSLESEDVLRSSASGASLSSFSSFTSDTPSTMSPFSEVPTPSVGTPCTTSYFPPGTVYHPQGLYSTDSSSSWMVSKQDPCSSHLNFSFDSVEHAGVEYAHRGHFPSSYSLQN